MAPSVLAPDNDARSKRRTGGDTQEFGEELETVLGHLNSEKSSAGGSLPVKVASAFDLVDEGHNHPSRSEAQVLLSALEEFIRSTIHAQPTQNHTQQSDNNLDAGTLNKNMPMAGSSPNSTASSDNLPSPVDKEHLIRPSSRPESQALLDALESFIQSNVQVQLAREGTPELDNRPGKSKLLNNKLSASRSAGNSPLDSDSQNKEQEKAANNAPVQRMPQKLMDGLRERVFNQMPIRLLTLGSEMKLLDRSEVLQHIMRKMSHIDERAFDEMVVRQGSEPGFDIEEKAELQVIEDMLRKYARYAILSHTWLQNEPEVTFSDWSSIRNYSGAGYKKLAGFCEVAAKESGVSLAWMDTICIDKDSSSELDESIRSMYNWYRHASICITYLYDTSSLADMAHDRWFTRGWTLQELLAPRRTQFYDKNWKRLGSSDDDKSDNSGTLCRIIEDVTGIPRQDFQDFEAYVNNPFTRHNSISRRMVWATNRMTTRGEDIAYSLMGIFGVSFPIAYGEGAERAFFRLIEAILISFQDVSDVLNWAGRPISRKIHSSRLIPSTPRCYLKKEDHIQTYPGWDEVALPSIPITLTHLGVQVRMLLFSCIKSEHLPHYNYSPTFYGEAEVQEDRSSNNYYFPQPPLDPSGRHRTFLSCVLGVWDFIEGENHVEMSPTNLAVLLKIRDSAKIYNMNGLEAADISSACETENVVILKLKLRNCPTFRVDKKDLGWHGMNVLTLHL